MYSCDKIGHYIGNLFVGGGRDSLVLSLLRQGCVYINEKAIDFCSNADAMQDAEDEAKEGRRGYWKEYKEPVKVGNACYLCDVMSDVMSCDE